MHCVFCRTSNKLVRQPVRSAPGKHIKEGRIAFVNVCESDIPTAEYSIDVPFSDRELINLYKTTIEG